VDGYAAFPHPPPDTPSVVQTSPRKFSLVPHMHMPHMPQMHMPHMPHMHMPGHSPSKTVAPAPVGTVETVGTVRATGEAGVGAVEEASGRRSSILPFNLHAPTLPTLPTMPAMHMPAMPLTVLSTAQLRAQEEARVLEQGESDSRYAEMRSTIATLVGALESLGNKMNSKLNEQQSSLEKVCITFYVLCIIIVFFLFFLILPPYLSFYLIASSSYCLFVSLRYHLIALTSSGTWGEV
jgi:hypothetical protein